ncbi:hypothetical protein C7B76_04640 [filamentous cyanobacterium CCP2]|nr:hypothetical protein C7B76_04640 [filamentous cyanobacterium CCP2]
MDAQSALRFVEQILASRLSPLQVLVFEQSWGDRSYQEIAKTAGYEVSYVKQTGSGLWQQLSEALGQKVTKRNLHRVLEQHYQESASSSPFKPNHPPATVPLTFSNPVDWGEAPDVSVFYGRSEELQVLNHWVLTDRCRLVGIFAMGGMGKTTLSVKLAQQLQPQFEGVIWRSIRHAPLPEVFLADVLQVLQPHSNERSLSFADQLRHFLAHLRQRRLLLILDNLEAILQAGDRTGHYQPGYEEYGQLLHHLGAMPHQSIVILTSREKPKELVAHEGILLPVRSLRLSGLDPDAGQALCHAKGTFTGLHDDWAELVAHYAGNPLALKLVAPVIQDCFEGHIAPFLEVLQQGNSIFGDIQDLLAGQFDRLSPLEQQVMTWLAIHREPISLNQLRAALLPPLPLGHLLEALTALERRSLIEKYRGRFTLQPAVMEYVTDRLVAQVSQELSQWIHQTVVSTHQLAWPPAVSAPALTPEPSPTLPPSLHHYGLIQTQTKDYLCHTQKRLILQPIVQQLLQQHRPAAIAAGCQHLLTAWRQQPLKEQGYSGGNVINLLQQIPTDLQGWDFSELRIWQADLRHASLQRVNFSGSDLNRSVFKETFSQVLSVAFSPDGEYLVASDISYEIHVWRGAETQPFRTFNAKDGWCWAIAISPNGRTLAGSANGVVHLWDLATGESQGELRGSEGRVFALSFSPDGCYLASGCEDHQIRVWEVRTGRLVWQLAGHSDEVRTVAFAPQNYQTPRLASPFPPSPSEGHQLVSGSHDGRLKLWDLTTGTCLDTWSTGTAPVLSVAFSPDGQTLASGSRDRTVRLWEMSTRECRHVLTGHQQQVRTVAFSPNGRTLASGSDDPMICLWDAASGQLISTLTGHSSWISSLAFSPDGQTLASGSEDQSVRLWDSQTQQVLKVLQGHNNGVWSVALSPDGRTLVSGGQDRCLRFWDLTTGVLQNALPGHDGWVLSVAFSADGRWLVSGSEDRTVRLWDGQTGELQRIWDEHQHEVWSVAIDPQGEWVASGSLDGTIKFWNFTTNHSFRSLTGHTRGIWAITVSPDGRTLASGSQDRTIRLWDVATGECQQVLTGHNCWIRGLAFSPNGRYLASGGSNGQVKLWDLQQQTHQSWEAHNSLLLAVAFSPDGQTLATCSGDRTVKLWDVNTFTCRQTLMGHQKWVRSLAFHPQGNPLISCGQDATIRVWNLDADRLETSHCQTLRLPRPYEGMCIANAIGLSEAQMQALQSLGAKTEFRSNAS